MIRPDKNGLVFYKGKYQTAQAIGFENVLHPFLKAEQFTHVIEIGTQFGGFTMAVRDALPDAIIHTYDIKSQEELGLGYFDEHNINFYCENIFGEEDYISSQFLTQIEESDKLLICVDGGDKPTEFNRIAPYLREGDTIMVHDYVEDLATAQQFASEDKWHWFECYENQISDASKANNLVSIYHELLEIVWRVKRKV